MTIRVIFRPASHTYTLTLDGLTLETHQTYEAAMSAAIELKHAVGN